MNFLNYGVFNKKIFLGKYSLYLGIAPWYSLAMNILLHFAYGNLFAIFNQLYHSSHEFEELNTLENLTNENRKLPPTILIKATAQHDESREILKEFESYQYPVYASDVHIWSDGDITTHHRFEHMAIKYKNIQNYYSKWKRVDEGGGKFDNKINHDDTNNKFVKDEEIKTVETRNEAMEYVYIGKIIQKFLNLHQTNQ